MLSLNSLILNSESKNINPGKGMLPEFIIYTRGAQHIIEFSSLGTRQQGSSFQEMFPNLSKSFHLLDYCLQEASEAQFSIDSETEVAGKNYRRFCLFFEPRKDESGIITGLAVYGFSNAFMQREEVFFDLAEAMPQLVWMANPDGKVFYYNSRVNEYAGAEKLSDGSWQWEGLLHEEDTTATAEAWKNSVILGTVYEIEHRVKMADGHFQWHLSRAFPQKNEEGEIVCWYGTATNIQTQKEFEEKLGEKEERLRIAIEATELGTWDIDLITGTVIASEKLNNILGFAPENKTSFQDFLEQVHPADRSMVEEKSREVVIIENGVREFDLVFRIIRKNDGETRWVKAKGRVYENKSGEYARFAGTMLDITSEKKAAEEINYKKALLEAQNESTPHGVLIVDGKGKILLCNRHFIEMWGIPQETIDSGDDFAALEYAKTQLLHPEEFFQRVKFLYGTSAEAGREEIFLKDGRVLERYGKAVVDEGHHAYGWAWHFRDITEQKRTQEEINLQRLLYQNILEGISDAFISYDFDWKLIYANQKAVEMSGRPVDQLIGKKLWELYPDMVNTPSFRIFQRVMTHRVPEQLEYFSEPNQSWLETKVYPTIEGIAIFGIDINERKKAEDALRESEEHFRQLADLVPQIIFTSDAKGKVDYFNKRWYEFTSFPESADNQWIEILHPDDIETTVKTWNESIETGNPYQIEYRFKTGIDGVYRWFLGKAVPIKNKNGEIIKWFGSCTDIDDQKRSSEKLEALVKERTIALERSNEDLQQFAHVASHDLKEPLRKIRTFSSRIFEEFEKELPDKAKLYIDKISKAANRMNTIIEGVLEYSTIESLHQSFENIVLNQIIREIEDDLEVVILAKNAKVQYTSLPNIEASRILIHQLFYNLINNSLKFSKNDVPPVINISGRIVQGQEVEGMSPEFDGRQVAEIMIEDNGIGFNQQYASRIFDTFSRLNSKDRYEGTGLGLALCRKIIARHKGQLVAEGREGQGARFTIYLPVEKP